MVLAGLSFRSATSERNPFTAHIKPWHWGQGGERKYVSWANYWGVATTL
jgi:hypothetical protein